MGTHKGFNLIPSVYEDVSAETTGKLTLRVITEGSWRFFKHSKSEKLFAANVDEKDSTGCSALHHAVIKNLPEIAEALIEAKVNKHATMLNGYTALHLAAMENNLKIGRMLIDAGFVANARTDSHRTPLDVANVWGHAEFIAMLRNQLCEKI